MENRSRRSWLLWLTLFVVMTLFPASSPQPATAQTATTGFASAVPCLDNNVNIATTCFADTIYAPVQPSDPALVRVTLNGAKQALVPIGATAGGILQRIEASSGIGAVYGLAYDDGAISGIQRLFVAAFTRRFTSYGPFGPGGVYEYRFDDGQVYGSFVVPDAGNDRPTNDRNDTAILSAVGTSGLGDIEISPDGETLYIMNLAAKRIERYDITRPSPRRLEPLPVPLNLISDRADIQAHLQPFALEFAPEAGLDETRLFVGVTYTGRSNNHPAAFVLEWSAKTNQWQVALSQPLVTRELNSRFNGSSYVNLLKHLFQDNDKVVSWNAWSEQLNRLPGEAHTRTIFHAQPFLTDIEFSPDGQFMRLGFRDRLGDITFFGPPPAGHYTATAQGDSLNYRWVHDHWQLVLAPPNRMDQVKINNPAILLAANQADWVNDHLHGYYGDTPAHVENHMGSLLAIPRDDGRETIVVTTLLGNNASGLMTHISGQVHPTSAITLIPSGTSKSTALGDLELLCTYAFVSGQLWFDQNGNGIREAGEPPLGGIRLEVLEPGRSTVIGHTLTAADGSYTFAVPPNRRLFLRVAPHQFGAGQPLAGMVYAPANAGGDDSRDSDAHPGFGVVEFASRHSGSDITSIALPAPFREAHLRQVDLGLTRQMQPSSIGGRVWLDLNRSGTQDTGEPGVAGVAIRLERLSGSAPVINTYPRATFSDAQGRYTFANLEPGRYRIFVTLPDGYAFAPFSAGSNRQRDSDIDPLTSFSPVIVLGSGENRPDIDVGLVANQMDLSLTLDGPTEAVVGDDVIYVIRFRHTGARAATNSELRMTMPTGATFLSASAPAQLSGSTLIWRFARLEPGTSQAIEVRLRAPTTIGHLIDQTISVSASISANPPDNNPANNSASVSTRLIRAELSVSKSASATVLAGDDLIYTLRLTNQGSAPAYDVEMVDRLPDQVDFVSLLRAPAGACRFDGSIHSLRCVFNRLEPAQEMIVSMQTRPRLTAPDRLDNRVTASTPTAGDSPTDNTATASTALLRPDPSIALIFAPAPAAAGERVDLIARYRNIGTGMARAATVTIDLPGETALLSVPASCQQQARQFTCLIGDLVPAAQGEIQIGMMLPPTIAVDQVSASATISATTPELPAHQINNQASATVAVTRPNPFVQLRAPASIVGQGSVFAYTIDYGNLYRRRPTQTRAAERTVLELELPADAQLVGASRQPVSQIGQRLRWELGTLGPQAAGSIDVVVQTSVPAGAVLPATARISTATPADDPIDNIASLTISVVQPPTTIGELTGDLRAAIRSELDPASRDANPANGVYLSSGSQIAWPLGEVLDLTPQLSRLQFADEPLPWPYAYQARVVGWSLTEVAIGKARFAPQAVDSRGIAGCRPGARPQLTPQLLTGCIYRYLGGQSREQLSASSLSERDLADQIHLYWSYPPAPTMRPDVYLYLTETLEPVRLTLQVEIEAQIVNQAPGSIGGIPLPPVPVAPLPDPARQIITGEVEITLLAPRSLVAPGS